MTHPLPVVTRLATRLASGLAALTLCLGGCASAPTHYLTLVPGAASSANRSSRTPRFTVVAVTVPSQVDQPELVVRQSDGTVALLEKERWIAPVGDEIRAALTLSLNRKWDDAASPMPMPTPDDAKAAPPSVQIRLDVQRFDSVPGEYALIAAISTLKFAPPGGPVHSASCRISVRVPVAAGFAALARGHQTAIDAIAALIVAESVQLSTGSVNCDAAPVITGAADS
jgi:uncharacterized lipoprotein YmbA